MPSVSLPLTLKRGLPLVLGAAAAAFVSFSGPAVTSAEARTVCRTERVCTQPRPVREVVTHCRMVRRPGMAPRRVCEDEVRWVRRGPPRCKMERVCRRY
ncbi:hypothetical protein [Chelatococcus composti]|jgi:hypothetical protein|uniref:Secreted protein n=1 Tax=Chelatococcus composti TaxID=1743235 RepID=A0A841K8P4_9HYPH|nr:hypothetical protein [Chelatococcus composti]MBB6168470.1 hypothetical protein [Chelatococcus composti]MBS7736450.1 hypothetical protein [Chelatococcus composti]GGG40346.1 hypothetical protein GCM10008026_21560 [Chelatococcus composti]